MAKPFEEMSPSPADARLPVGIEARLQGGISADAASRHTAPESARAKVALIAQALLNRLPELADRAFRGILESEASYRQAVPHEELRQAAYDALGLMLQRLAGVRVSPQFDGCDEIHGERRARQGVPFEALVRCSHRDFQILWDAIREESLRAGVCDPETLLEGVTPLWEVVDVLSTRMAVGYHRAEAEMSRLDDQRRDAFFDALVDGRGSEQGVARQAAAALSLPEQGPYAVVALDEESEEDGRRLPRTGMSSTAFYRIGMQSAWRHRRDGSLGLVALGPRGLKGLLAALAADCRGRVGVSPAFDALAQTALACQFAEAALRTLARDSRGVVALDDRLAEALVASNTDLARRLVERVLGPIRALRESESARLLETLEVFIETGGSASATATRLYCHRNTIVQRLRKIEDLTGLSARHARGAVQLYLALQAHRLVPPESSSSHLSPLEPSP